MWLTLALITVLHLPVADHACHLQNSDWWSEALTAEDARSDSEGVGILA